MHRGESTFTTHKVEIPVLTLNEPIYLIPFGDIHRWAPLCDEKKWTDFLEWAERKKNAYFLGMGDYDDLASYSERQALLTANFHDSTLMSIEDLSRKRTESLIDEVYFMKGRIIGLLEGNHFGELSNGMSTTQLMCQKLECRYLGVSSFVRLVFVHGTKRCSIDLWLHHGKGASRLVGGSLNTVQQMGESAEADIYLMGHDHKKGIATKTRLVLNDSKGGLKLSHKKVLYGRTGSFLKGYEPDVPSYVVRAGMSPTDLGVIKIELTPKRVQKTIVSSVMNKETNKAIRHRTDIFYVDVHASL